jgi:N-acetylmuramoyl-L-alanine amidase
MFNLFSKPLAAPQNYPRIDKVGIIVGHTAKSPGAVITNGETVTNEYLYNSAVVAELVKNGCLDFYTTRDNGGIQQATRNIIHEEIDLSIELHTNAFNRQAYGCEALYYTQQSKRPAELFCQYFCDFFDRKNRGAKDVVKNGRGVYNLQLLEDIPYAVLVEPFFGDNQREFISVKDYASFLIDFIDRIKYQSTTWR